MKAIKINRSWFSHGAWCMVVTLEGGGEICFSFTDEQGSEYYYNNGLHERGGEITKTEIIHWDQYVPDDRFLLECLNYWIKFSEENSE